MYREHVAIDTKYKKKRREHGESPEGETLQVGTTVGKVDCLENNNMESEKHNNR